jgi:hypothetical protein
MGGVVKICVLKNAINKRMPQSYKKYLIKTKKMGGGCGLNRCLMKINVVD